MADRYEWRAFASNLGLLEERLRRRAPVEGIAESDEIYVVSRHCDTENVKVRGGALDIKTLVKREGPLEQWSPAGKLSFPLAANLLEEKLFSLLGVPVPALPEGDIEIATLVEQVLRQTDGLAVITLFKRRWKFSLNDCACELADVRVNGALLRSACVEAENPDAVLALAAELGLDAYTNTNYVSALRQVAGFIPVTMPW